MPAVRRASRHPVGLLLVRGEVDWVARWAARGLVAVHALPLTPWTAVLPAEPTSRVGTPYDDAAAALAGRPVGPRLRPAIGFFVIDGRAALTLHASGWRAPSRWLAWQPGNGIVPTAGLPRVRPSDLVSASRVASGTAPADARAVARVLRERHDTPVEWLLAVLLALDLPGAHLLGRQEVGAGHGGRLVEPHSASIGQFEALVAEEAAHRAELEERG